MSSRHLRTRTCAVVVRLRLHMKGVQSIRYFHSLLTFCANPRFYQYNHLRSFWRFKDYKQSSRNVCVFYDHSEEHDTLRSLFVLNALELPFHSLARFFEESDDSFNRMILKHWSSNNNLVAQSIQL